SLVYGLRIQLPDIAEQGFLDKLVLWTREVMREIEFAQIDEIEFEHVVSGRQPSFGRTGPRQTIPEADWNTAIANAAASGKFDFDIRTSFVDVGAFTNLR